MVQIAAAPISTTPSAKSPVKASQPTDVARMTRAVAIMSAANP